MIRQEEFIIHPGIRRKFLQAIREMEMAGYVLDVTEKKNFMGGSRFVITARDGKRESLDYIFHSLNRALS